MWGWVGHAPHAACPLRVSFLNLHAAARTTTHHTRSTIRYGFAIYGFASIPWNHCQLPRTLRFPALHPPGGRHKKEGSHRASRIENPSATMSSSARTRLVSCCPCALRVGGSAVRREIFLLSVGGTMAKALSVPLRFAQLKLSSRRGLIIPIAATLQSSFVPAKPTSALFRPRSTNRRQRDATPPTPLQSSTPPRPSAARRAFSDDSSNMTSPKPEVHGLFHEGTSTMTYIISDPATKQAIILDSVLDYDASSGRTSNSHNDAVVDYCAANSLDVRYILESHVHGECSSFLGGAAAHGELRGDPRFSVESY